MSAHEGTAIGWGVALLALGWLASVVVDETSPPTSDPTVVRPYPLLPIANNAGTCLSNGEVWAPRGDICWERDRPSRQRR